MELLRRGGEACAVGFVPTDRILLPPVDRDGMRRKAGSAVECELKHLGGGCRKLCIVRRRRERSRASLRSGTSWRRPSVPGSKSGTPASSCLMLQFYFLPRVGFLALGSLSRFTWGLARQDRKIKSSSRPVL